MDFSTGQCAIHVSKTTKNWFLEIVITVMDWPPLSPDLNPMENVWGLLARTIYKDGRQYQNVQALQQAITESLDKLHIDDIRHIIDSMRQKFSSS